MELILWRHAEASPARAGQDDLARELTAKGERQARRMAEWLTPRLADDALILASPAVRTRQTAEALGRPFSTVPALAPDAAVRAVLDAAGWPDAPAPVVVVGHQPTLGMVAATLLAGQPLRWSIRKGAVWWFRRRDGEEGGLLLQAVQSPET